MTTITKERLLKIQHWRETYGADSNVMLPAEEAAELARIALASLEAEKGADPVVFTDERNLRHIASGRETSLIWGKQNQEVGDIPLYRHAQPVPVDKEFIPKNLDKALGVVGVALPESKEEFNFQIERWIQRLIDRVIHYADEFKEQPVPVVPEECPAELPYAQVKAAADLYALCWQSGEVVTYTPAPEKATIWLNNYSGTCVQEYVKLERLQEALSGYSPVIPRVYLADINTDHQH
ncbi:hypothetical protein A9221_10300 [Salmonella enterica]|nr:hypothetical protein [Salmonella enterica]EFQ2500235.1 hypothetical protein [Salmonella enterica]